MHQYPAEALLPGHTRPIIGREAVADVLRNFRDVLDFGLTATLACMDLRMRIEETVNAVKLPETYRRLPYLQKHYGTVAWSVRSIYSGYLGGLDGDPANLNPLPPRERFKKTVGQMDGKDAVSAAVREALSSRDTQ